MEDTEPPFPSPSQFDPNTTPFGKAATQLDQMSWRDFDRADRWQDVLPMPEFSAKPMLARFGYYTPENSSEEGKLSIREQQLEWELRARNYFDEKKAQIEGKQTKVQRLITQAVQEHEGEQGRKFVGNTLNPEILTVGYFAELSQKKGDVLTVADMCRHYVHDTRVFAFVRQRVTNYRNRLGLSEPLPQDTINQNVTPSDIDWDKAPNKFNNGFPLSLARKYFLQLTVPPTKPRKNKQPFLTTEQVDLFLRRAFIKETGIDKLEIIVPSGNRLYLFKMFHQLFYYCTGREYEDDFQGREKYARLLTDNFNGFKPEEVMANFGSGKTRRSWKNPDELD